MLYIVVRDGKIHNWHIDEQNPCDTDPSRVVELQADGHELGHIAMMYPHLVAHGKCVVRFFGCIAQTIVANL